jgi:toxin ParE1/3/4
MAEYRLSPAAEADLEAIWLYSAQTWGVEQADRYIDLLSSGFADLAQLPQMAHACDHLRPGYRRWRVERHVVYFRLADYGIAVIRVLHDRMDATRHL